MKILLVFDGPKELINGVSQSVLNLEKGLTDEGHDVRVLMSSPDGRARIDGKHLLAPSRSLARVYPGFRLSLSLTGKIRKAVLKWKPDIIHSNTEGPLYLKAIRLADKSGAKHIHSFHTNFMDFYYAYFPFGRRFTQAFMMTYGKMCFRRLDGVITPSSWGKQIIERLHLSAPHYILHNGIHTEIFSADHKQARERIRQCYGIGEREKLLVFVGRIAAEKNIPELISCFCKISNETVKLMVVGSGPELDSLKSEVKLMPEAQRILFTGMIPSEDIADYYAASDVFVTSSHSEVQPLTYVEAMASGLPVVCAEAPYVKGLVIDGKTGYAFRSGEEFTEAINAIVSNEEYARQMGENARALVSWDYSIENFSKSAIRLYSQVLEGEKS